MTLKIPLMIIPLGAAKKISRRFVGIGGRLASLVPGLKYDINEADVELSDAEYIAACLVNCLAVFILSFALFFALSYNVQAKDAPYSLILGLLSASIICLFLFIVLIRYPGILAGKKAEQVDKNLVFALKDLSLQISSGVSLYNAMVNVSKSGYGLASREFEKAAKSVNTGTPMDTALERMAVESKSEYLRKTTWQMVNTLKAGASLKGALRAVINDLTADQRARISSYAKELNLWSLTYMLFAVAIPTIGSTMMIILSSFAGAGITKGLFVLFLTANLIVQYVIIGLIKTRRPMVQF